MLHILGVIKTLIKDLFCYFHLENYFLSLHSLKKIITFLLICSTYVTHETGRIHFSLTVSRIHFSANALSKWIQCLLLSVAEI